MATNGNRDLLVPGAGGMTALRRALAAGVALLGLASLGRGAAAPVDTLREFVRDVKTGHAQFTQTVTSPDGVKKKTSSGSFDFARPNRFRFAYAKPFEQTIVADGEKVWIYDRDLNQASSRRIGQALGATPAALLAGGSLDKDFELSQPAGARTASNGPRPGRRRRRARSSRCASASRARTWRRSRSSTASARSRCCASRRSRRTAGAAETFRFTVPAGADVIEQ